MKLKLGIIGFFFCLMAALGVLAIEDTQEPVPLPIDSGLVIQGKTDKSNVEVYKLIDEISQKAKVEVYKPVVPESGKLTYIKLNSKSDNKLLNQSPVIGMYYTLGKLSAKDLKPLKNLGFQTISSSYPWYIGGFVQFNGTLRALLMISIYLIIFIVLLINEIRKMKEGVIRRSLGLPINSLTKDFGLPIVFNLALIIILETLFVSFIGNGFMTYSSKLFLALLLTNFIIFQIINSRVTFIFYLNIKLEKTVEIIKNKVKTQGLFVVWLLMICVMIFISGVVLKESKQTQQSLNSQLESLSPWKKTKNWQRLEIIDLGNKPSQNGELQHSEEEDKRRSEQDLKLMSSIKGKDFLYLDSSGVYVQKFMDPKTKEESKKRYESDGITDSEVNKKLIYLNQSGAALENSLNDTKYKSVKGKIASIYIPEQFEKSKDSIISTVLAEQFTGTNFTKNDISAELVPDRQKLFYFNENGDDFSKLPEYFLPNSIKIRDKNNIIVVLDTERMIDLKDPTLASNMISNGLFSPSAVREIVQASQNVDFSVTPVTVYQIIELKIQSYKHQLLLSKILQNLIFFILFLSVYQYARLLILSKQSDHVKMIILGLSKWRMALSNLKYLIVLITSSILLTVFLTGQYELLLLGLGLLIILLFSSIRSFKIISQKYPQILKGEQL